MNNGAHFSNAAPIIQGEALFNHLVFAFKYEGVDLLLFAKR
jgi:hypothetical protein